MNRLKENKIYLVNLNHLETIMTKKPWFGIHVSTYGNTFEDVKQSCLESERQGLEGYGEPAKEPS